MHAQWLKYWIRLTSSFWFVPSLMACGAALLALISIALDKTVTDQWLRAIGWVYSGGAEGASAVLGTIAGSMITIAGVVFSMTLIALSLASSQLGPRMLRNFMRDTANQVVLGTFIATFVYCLLVLLTIRHENEGAFVPQLSVSMGVLFALASLGVLIYFIHHVSVSIQADQVVAQIAKELIAAIDRLFPQHTGQTASQPADVLSEPDQMFSQATGTITADADGYLQLIEGDALVALAKQANVVLQLQRRPGHYLVCGSPLVRVWPEMRISKKFAAQVNAAFVLGHQRTAVQDIEFAVLQLVEIAVRALSPGVNDPFSAIVCVDRLGSALSRLAQRDIPSPQRFDDKGQLRLVVSTTTFAGIVDAAFNQIRQSGRSSPAVTLRLLETISVIAPATRRLQDQAALRRQAEMIVQAAHDALPEQQDRQAVEERFQAANQALFKASAESPGASPQMPIPQRQFPQSGSERMTDGNLPTQVVFLLDVDNTLLDNDRFAADLTTRLDQDVGQLQRERYWSIYAKLRDRLGYVDYLAALQALRANDDDQPALLRMSSFLLDYPFSERLYPRALAALEYLGTLGTTAIVSDGDILFQPRKIQRSGLWNAVEGRVLVTLHKEHQLELIQRRFPARHYVMIDDKPQLLTAMKQALGTRLTTVLVRQGHYAAEFPAGQSQSSTPGPAPDMSLEHIGDVCELTLEDFRVARSLDPASTAQH